MSQIHVVSFSELDTYRQCPLKHLLSYKQRWKSPDAKPALSKGSLWHAVQEAHLGVIKDWWKAERSWSAGEVLLQARLLVEDIVRPEGEYVEHGELIEWMYDGYVEHYGVDEEWQPLAIEFPFQIPLLNAAGRPTRYHIKGKIDAVMRNMDTGLLWIWDHKSGANLPSQMDLEIDDQFGVYTWAFRQLGKRVAGSMHNAARTTRNQADFPDYEGKSKPQTMEQRHSRTYLNRSDTELTTLALDAYNAARNAYPPKSMQLPIYSSPDPRQCGWKCDFKEAHLQARSGQDWKSILEERGYVQDFTRH